MRSASKRKRYINIIGKVPTIRRLVMVNILKMILLVIVA